MKRIKLVAVVLGGLIAVALIIVLAINLFMIFSVKENILSDTETFEGETADCIIVLGAGVNGETPSHMLEDRLLAAIALYEAGAAPKIIMSGDHSRTDYDEVNVMKEFAVERGVPSEDIFMDHAGFSTYESIYRAKEIFGAEEVIVVTQKYHLYRALYIADELDVEATGVSADLRRYRGEINRQAREAVARIKDMLWCTFEPAPTYLGERIDLGGNGDVTNDK